jgi:hypothetical protein
MKKQKVLNVKKQKEIFFSSGFECSLYQRHYNNDEKNMFTLTNDHNFSITHHKLQQLME